MPGVATRGMSVDVTRAEALNVLARREQNGPLVAAGPERRHLILQLALLTSPTRKKSKPVLIVVSQ